MNNRSINSDSSMGFVGKTTGRGSNQSGMRAYNERLVLSLVRQSGQLAKSEITQLTGLSAQTVSVIMRALEADGLLEKGAPVRGKVGQPSVPMSLRKDGAFFLGLKVGRRRLELVMTDFLGAVEHRTRERYSHPTPDRVVQMANHAVAARLDSMSEKGRARVAGLGIALPFQLWDWPDLMGAARSQMDEWRSRDIGAEIGAHWPFPVFECNDASAACGAELVFGDQDKPRDFLYFYVGHFVGGGLVLENGLYTGQSGNAAALGSTPIVTTDGKPAQLGDVASLITLETELAAAGSDMTDLWDAAASEQASTNILNRWLDNAAGGMAQAILSSACVIDFKCVLIDGRLPSSARKDLVQRTRLCLAEMPLAGVETPEVREGSIGEDARSLGAASLPLAERFLVDRNAFLKG